MRYIRGEVFVKIKEERGGECGRSFRLLCRFGIFEGEGEGKGKKGFR